MLKKKILWPKAYHKKIKTYKNAHKEQCIYCLTGTCRDTKIDSIGATSEPKQHKFWNAGNSQVCQSQIFNYTVKEWIILTYYKNDLNIEDCY